MPDPILEAAAPLLAAQVHHQMADGLYDCGFPFDWSERTPPPIPPEVLAAAWHERSPAGDASSLEDWTLTVRQEGGWGRA